MGPWRFDSVAQWGKPLATEHDDLLIIASVLIAVLASSVLIPAIDRCRSSTSLKHSLVWAVTGGLALAFGVWGMHFCALLALQLPVSVSFDPVITAVSALPAVISAAIVIGLCQAPLAPLSKLCTAAIAMAAGITVMHFISMQAIVAPVHIGYNLWLLGLFFLLAVALIRLVLTNRMRQLLRTDNPWRVRLAGTVLLGMVISATHYILVQAMVFYPDPAFAASINEVDPRSISFVILAVAVALVGLLFAAVIIDRRISHIARSLSDSELRFKALAETSACAIFTFERTFTYANPALSEISGYSESELKHTPVEALFGNLSKDLFKVRRGPKQAIAIAQEVEIRCRGGEKRWLYMTVGQVDHAEGTHYVGSALDITERRHMERRLRHLAFYDSLTGLTNRICFIEALQKRLDLRRQRGFDNDQCALLTINLGRLKWINDNFGQGTGDRLLRDISRGLRTLTRREDLLARVGGHEYAILLRNTAAAETAIEMAQAILDLFARPYSANKQEIQLRCQVGIALATPGIQDAEDLLRQGYIAMNQARKQSTNSFCLFDHEMRESGQRRLQLESDLSRALVENRFELYYQPIVGLPRGDEIYGFEALIRWPRSDGSFTSPADFIPVAEDIGLIGPLGDWVLETACRQLQLWNQQSDKRVYVSVNISSLQLFQPQFASRVAELIEQYEIGPGELKLELTEGVLVEDGTNVLRTMRDLLALGCEIMIDDFGTGYSSLSYLSRFPASVLKIDQSFIQSIGADDVGAPIIKAIVSMARDLDLDIIAEGVENQHAAQILESIGCENAQGYLFSRPLPTQGATDMLLRARHDHVQSLRVGSKPSSSTRV